jgi:hypothetical protein
MKGVAVILVALALSLAPALAQPDSSTKFGIYPQIAVQAGYYAVGALLTLAGPAMSITWCPPADAFAMEFFSKTWDAYYLVGVSVTGLSSPPITYSPYIGIGWWPVPYVYGQVFIGYTGTPGFTIGVVLRF